MNDIEAKDLIQREVVPILEKFTTDAYSITGQYMVPIKDPNMNNSLVTLARNASIESYNSVFPFIKNVHQDQVIRAKLDSIYDNLLSSLIFQHQSYFQGRQVGIPFGDKLTKVLAPITNALTTHEKDEMFAATEDTIQSVDLNKILDLIEARLRYSDYYKVNQDLQNWIVVFAERLFKQSHQSLQSHQRAARAVVEISYKKILQENSIYFNIPTKVLQDLYPFKHVRNEMHRMFAITLKNILYHSMGMDDKVTDQAREESVWNIKTQLSEVFEQFEYFFDSVRKASRKTLTKVKPEQAELVKTLRKALNNEITAEEMPDPRELPAKLRDKIRRHAQSQAFSDVKSLISPVFRNIFISLRNPVRYFSSDNLLIEAELYGYKVWDIVHRYLDKHNHGRSDPRLKKTIIKAFIPLFKKYQFREIVRELSKVGETVDPEREKLNEQFIRDVERFKQDLRDINQYIAKFIFKSNNFFFENALREFTKIQAAIHPNTSGLDGWIAPLGELSSECSMRLMLDARRCIQAVKELVHDQGLLVKDWQNKKYEQQVRNYIFSNINDDISLFPNLAIKAFKTAFWKRYLQTEDSRVNYPEPGKLIERFKVAILDVIIYTWNMIPYSYYETITECIMFNTLWHDWHFHHLRHAKKDTIQYKFAEQYFNTNSGPRLTEDFTLSLSNGYPIHASIPEDLEKEVIEYVNNKAIKCILDDCKNASNSLIDSIYFYENDPEQFFHNKDLASYRAEIAGIRAHAQIVTRLMFGSRGVCAGEDELQHYTKIQQAKALLVDAYRSVVEKHCRLKPVGVYTDGSGDAYEIPKGFNAERLTKFSIQEFKQDLNQSLTEYAKKMILLYPELKDKHQWPIGYIKATNIYQGKSATIMENVFLMKAAQDFASKFEDATAKISTNFINNVVTAIQSGEPISKDKFEYESHFSNRWFESMRWNTMDWVDEINKIPSPISNQRTLTVRTEFEEDLGKKLSELLLELKTVKPKKNMWFTFEEVRSIYSKHMSRIIKIMLYNFPNFLVKEMEWVKFLPYRLSYDLKDISYHPDQITRAYFNSKKAKGENIYSALIKPIPKAYHDPVLLSSLRDNIDTQLKYYHNQLAITKTNQKDRLLSNHLDDVDLTPLEEIYNRFKSEQPPKSDVKPSLVADNLLSFFNRKVDRSIDYDLIEADVVDLWVSSTDRINEQYINWIVTISKKSKGSHTLRSDKGTFTKLTDDIKSKSEYYATKAFEVFYRELSKKNIPNLDKIFTKSELAKIVSTIKYRYTRTSSAVLASWSLPNLKNRARAFHLDLIKDVFFSSISYNNLPLKEVTR